MLPIHHEIIDYLEAKAATSNDPKSSFEIGCDLNVTPSYVRLVIKRLLIMEKVQVRKGRGGGYYLC